MSKHIGIVIYLVSFCFAALMPVIPLWAEDEDLDSTVYLVFDPETGELITVQEPSIASRYHNPQDATPTHGAQDPAAASSESDPFPLLLGGAVALGLLGGAVAWIRKNRQQPSS
ncbi:MAG: hypothetical protein O7D92_06145 [Proteobacteria bacterium]|nr:hypothetical protein [Pseudomonadota bacterium]